MNKVFKHFYWLLLPFFFACSGVRLKQTSSKGHLPKEVIRDIDYFSMKDSLPADTLRIGDFVLREDLNASWDVNKIYFERFMKKNHANVAVVKKLGWGIKGHLFYMEGTIYYCSPKQLEQHRLRFSQETTCGIVLLRDDKKGSLASAYTLDVNIDGNKYPDLKAKTIIRHRSSNCKELKIALNKEENLVELEDGVKYFRVYRASNVGSTGFGLSYAFGSGIYIIETHPTLGRILAQEFSEYSEQSKN
ncbi:MAG: hypothetical protein MUF75_12330 [Bacteroidia bacterium]|jgi:hypothetical protein|nr:hypothetical protein [Bacteroidia bacterium]